MTPSLDRIGEDDIAMLSDLHRVVFAGTMGTSLGNRYLRAFFRWFRDHEPATALVARCDGSIAGYALGAPHGHGSRVTRDLLPTILFSVATHPAAWKHPNFLLQLRTRALSLVGRDAPQASGPVYGSETYDLVAIGTVPSQRRTGVSSALLKELESAARSRGFARIILHVYSDNQPARAFYRRHEYHVAFETERVVTMEKRL